MKKLILAAVLVGALLVGAFADPKPPTLLSDPKPPTLLKSVQQQDSEIY